MMPTTSEEAGTDVAKVERGDSIFHFVKVSESRMHVYTSLIIDYDSLEQGVTCSIRYYSIITVLLRY